MSLFDAAFPHRPTCHQALYGALSRGLTKRADIVAYVCKEAQVVSSTVSAELSYLVASGVAVRVGRGRYQFCPELVALLADDC